jgi:hypothetical protein
LTIHGASIRQPCVAAPQVHRQTAASAVKHLALGVAGLGCEDALVHLLNFVSACKHARANQILGRGRGRGRGRAQPGSTARGGGALMGAGR